MPLKVETKRRHIAAGAIGFFIGVGWLSGHLLGVVPPFEKRCMEQCRAEGKSFEVLPLYPKTMTGAKGDGFFQKKCECR